MQTDVLTPQGIFCKVIRYDIPPFQRPYIWTQEQQWEPLWEDLTELAESIAEKGSVAPHFMGAIVLQQINNPMLSIETRVVVDGQQRLTTIQLLLDAIQEFCMEAGFDDSAARLAGLVLNPEAFTGSQPDLAFKLWPTTYDQDAFRHAMHNDLDSGKFSGNRIAMAHTYFKGQVRHWLSQPPQAVINLDQNDDPHVIFETLNARGTPLLPSDMVKNHILSKAGIGVGYEDEEMSQEAKRLWPFSEEYWRQEVGRGFQRRPRIDLFLNNWLAMRNGNEVRAHQEFQAFENYVEERRDDQSIRQIAADMGNLGQLFREIDEESIPQLSDFLYRRRVMNAGTVVPPLLWLLSSDVPEDQLRKAVTALDSFMVRRVIAGLHARSYNQLFTRLAGELATGGPESAGDTVVNYLSQQEARATKWPDNAELRDAFLNFPLYDWLTQGRTRFILEGVERGMRSHLAETDALPGSLQIEHVMPRAWPQNWPLPDAPSDSDQAWVARDRIIHTIGNLTLTSGRLNQSMSNGAWQVKRAALYEHSVLFLNKDLLSNAPKQWDEAAIEARSRRLHAAAVRIWPSAQSLGAEAHEGG